VNTPGRHIVVVEAYQGLAEHVSGDPDAVASGRALGLPLEALADRLDARVTILTWDRFVELERNGESFVSWMPVPATRPLSPPAALDDRRRAELAERFPVVPIPTRDPDHGSPIETAGLSQMSHGLLANSDPLFFMSCCLQEELRRLHERDPYRLVILPCWGGLGYTPQLARATRSAGHVDVPFAVVVTDRSANRQRANLEGMWNRQAVTRRQCEDLSLALADLALVYGNRGEKQARRGRVAGDDAIVRIPRHVPDAMLDKIAGAAERRGDRQGAAGVFIVEPMQASAGVLTALDAAVLLRQRKIGPAGAITACGPDMIFAPMAPRTFADYWRSRAFVRELIADGYWRFEQDRPQADDNPAVRLYPYHFSHLPEVWSELARGSSVLLSPAAGEGLIPAGDDVPAGALVGDALTPERLANALERLDATAPGELDAVRRSLCRIVVDGHRSPRREAMLDDASHRLAALCDGGVRQQDVGRVAHLLLDRSTALAEMPFRQAQTKPGRKPANRSLTVVVPCFEMGAMLAETIESIWNSDRPPDELIVVDDGSTGSETLETIDRLSAVAAGEGRPFRVVRQENRGLAGARNRGLEEAGGTYICFVDGDDLIEPTYFGLATDLLDDYPLLGGVAAWSRVFNESGDVGFWNAPQAELPFLYSENCVFVPVVARTQTVRELGGYDTAQRFNYEDWELSCRFLARGKPIITIPAYLQRYRVRDESLLRTMTPVQNQVMRECFLDRHAATVARHAGELALLMENRLLLQLNANAENAPGDAAGFSRAPSRKLKGLMRTMAVRIRAAARRMRRNKPDQE
jgi:hypothetical protein